MNEQFLAALQAENLPVSLDESLGRHTTFRIGGNADFFCVPATVTQLTVFWNCAANIKSAPICWATVPTRCFRMQGSAGRLSA